MDYTFTCFFSWLVCNIVGWNIRKTNYGVIAFSRVMNVLSNKSYVILIGIISVTSATALILGTLIGSIIMSLLLFFWSFSEIKVIFKIYQISRFYYLDINNFINSTM